MSLPLPSDSRAREWHGMTHSRVYKVWTGMHSRCNTPSATGYENYGGKGIKVCDRWKSFTAFLADMGLPPPGMSIERNDSLGDYEPWNCRWATRVEQNRNHHDLRYLTHAGKTQCVSAWAEELAMPASSLLGRVKRGWSAEKALTTPIRAHKPYERRVST